MEKLEFKVEAITATIVAPDGRREAKPVEIRTDPLTGRTCRITFARAAEKETGTAEFPETPPSAKETSTCPFCRPQLTRRTPMLSEDLSASGRLETGTSVLFPNLFPYGRYSAVSLFDDHHFVEIGTASRRAYRDSFSNGQHYLQKVLTADPAAVYTAITQNHLPSAGGSLVHPHLQVHADRHPPNNLRFLEQRAADFHARTGQPILSAYLAHEQTAQARLIGRTGNWHWLAAFAPEGFWEVWGILPGRYSILDLDTRNWDSLARGVLNTQKFYRSLNRNGYNLGLLSVEKQPGCLEMRVRILARSNYAPWVRNDHTGYEVMLGDMATFNAPEETARLARPFWATS